MPIENTSVVRKSDFSTWREDLIRKPDQEEVLEDYRIACLSREASLLARKDVLTGKAKFGIIGDGKELPQVAMAKFFRPGDFRSGYYRDQTLMFALGLADVKGFFAQLYADPAHDPFSGGRQMNSHFGSPLSRPDGKWIEHVRQPNVSADLSSTAGQMARSLGLALASKKYRALDIPGREAFSKNGNEVCFCTIGDASTSQGVFWETMNAAGVMQVPLAVSVWDDGYGISVPAAYQTIKESISEAMAGMEGPPEAGGIRICRAKGWDFPGLMNVYAEAIGHTRQTHQPVLIHVTELTQPQGHSTSGSHERYKSRERLAWEEQQDCLIHFRRWIIQEGYAGPEQLEAIQIETRKAVKAARDQAWKDFHLPVRKEWNRLRDLAKQVSRTAPEAQKIKVRLDNLHQPVLSELVQLGRQLYYASPGTASPARQELKTWLEAQAEKARGHYQTHLYQESGKSALSAPRIEPVYAADAPRKNGYEILNRFFDHILEKHPEVMAFGEDVGRIGDVNQGFAGLQKKYGEARVFDTGIREWTIMGQAIGLAMRGFRPIAEIQYLDYLVYGLPPLTDDLATLHWRSDGTQQAPAIIRTRGHRLEGVWHAGSPLGMVLNALRGMFVLVPRNMVQAAGMYNTLLHGNDPALLIECLNGYRRKERLPENLGEYTVPLGIPDFLRRGNDLSIVTYGSCVRVADKACGMLADLGIQVDLIDVQTLLPFDTEHRVLESIKRTSRVLFLDEDVPGGATAFMMQQVLETQGGFRFLDSPPATLTARPHRTPYGSDGDYFTKPNPEDVFEVVYRMVREADPGRFPSPLDLPSPSTSPV